MQVMLCQSDLILLHKWGLDDSQSHTTVEFEWSGLFSKHWTLCCCIVLGTCFLCVCFHALYVKTFLGPHNPKKRYSNFWKFFLCFATVLLKCPPFAGNMRNCGTKSTSSESSDDRNIWISFWWENRQKPTKTWNWRIIEGGDGTGNMEKTIFLIICCSNMSFYSRGLSCLCRNFSEP